MSETATEVQMQNVLKVDDGQLCVGEHRLSVVTLQRTQRAWHELESAVKRNKQRLTSKDRELLENIVLGEASAAQRGWSECRQALEQAQLL